MLLFVTFFRGEGINNMQIKEVLFEGLTDWQIQTKIALAAALGNKRTRGNPLQNAGRF